MFLDDQLYEKVKQSKIEKPEDFKTLVNELYKITEDYFKTKLRADMTYTEGRIVMDKTFKLWDIFVDKLDKEDWRFVAILKDNSYKENFMSNPKLKEIYDRGK